MEYASLAQGDGRPWSHICTSILFHIVTLQ